SSLTYLIALPSFAESVLSFVFDKIGNIRLGSLYSAFAIMFLPVALFGIYSPFAIRLVLLTAQRSGTVSGAVFGVSTAGSIVGTLTGGAPLADLPTQKTPPTHGILLRAAEPSHLN